MTKDRTMEMCESFGSDKEFLIRNKVVELNSSFETFTANLVKLLGRFDPAITKSLADQPVELKKKLEAMQGEQGLMLFDIMDHAVFINIHGKQAKVKQYTIGNPLIAASMTRFEIRAGLYAPLRILIYEDENKVAKAEYDRPSSLFGQFGNDEVLNVSKSLDQKLLNLIKTADGQSL